MKRRELLEAELKGFQPIPEEEERILEAGLLKKTEAAQALETQQKAVSAQIAWHERIAGLTQEQAACQQRQATLREQREAFKPSREQLEKANLAQTLNGEAATRKALAAEQRQEQLQQVEDNGRLPLLESTLEAAGKTHAAAAETLAAAQEKAANLAPVLKQAQQLDVEIREKAHPLAEKQKALQAADKALRKQREVAAETARNSETCQQNLTALAAVLTQTARDEQLVTELAGLRERLDAIRTQQRQQRQRATAWEDAKKAQGKAEREQTKLAEDQQALREKLAVEKTAYETRKSAFEKLLAGEPLSGFRQKSQQLADRLQQLRAILSEHGTGKAQLTRLEAVIRAEEESQAEAQMCRAALGQHQAALASQSRETELLAQQVQLLKRITDLTKERAHLEAGKPCPLCGATEHPYADGQLPGQDETDQALTAAKKREKALTSQVQADEIALAKLAATQEHAARERQERLLAFEQGMQRAEGLWTDMTAAPLPEVGRFVQGEAFVWPAFERICLETGDAGGETTTEAAVTKALRLIQAQEAVLAQGEIRLAEIRAALVAFLEKAEAEELALQGLRDGLEREAAAVTQADEEMRQVVNEVAGCRAQAERLSEETASFGRVLTEAVDKLCVTVRAYVPEDVEPIGGADDLENAESPGDADVPESADDRGAVSHSISWLERVFPILAERQAQWTTRQNERRQLFEKLAVLTEQQAQQALGIEQHEAEMEALRQEVAAQTLALEALRKTRSLLLDGRAVADVEAESRQALDVAQAAEKQALASGTEARNALEAVKARQADRSERLSSREARLTVLHEQFCRKLQELGFPDEDAWAAANIPEAARMALQEQALALEKETHANETRLAEVSRKLAEEQASASGTEPKDALLEQKTALDGQMTSLQQDIGAMRQELAHNRQLRVQAADKLRQYQAQQQVCQHWNSLHVLIGSADGKKYRNFAQGITFDMMVRHANVQLAKLSDRYLLTLDKDAPLELFVMDNYQAGEKRSTKNLSGGESFLVSLALALGLSSMASRKVRVDSLFLDEGFGTLDEETLSAALETLASLHQDGKLIGVISHVGALKERIPTQIEVIPQAHGRSRLKGPGCRGSDPV
jgi:exonuclease SbcC